MNPDRFRFSFVAVHTPPHDGVPRLIAYDTRGYTVRYWYSSLMVPRPNPEDFAPEHRVEVRAFFGIPEPLTLRDIKLGTLFRWPGGSDLMVRLSPNQYNTRFQVADVNDNELRWYDAGRAVEPISTPPDAIK